VQKAKKWQNRKAFKAAGISTLSFANIEIIYKKAPSKGKNAQVSLIK
jgi:hypothetical protein